VDGIHILTNEEVRELTDIKVFVDTDADISFIRRLLRDTKERGRSVESIINQYIETVKPMQEKYIVPAKQYADFIISDGGYNYSAIKELIEMIKERIKE
jgi:uridine kinase